MKYISYLCTRKGLMKGEYNGYSNTYIANHVTVG